MNIIKIILYPSPRASLLGASQDLKLKDNLVYSLIELLLIEDVHACTFCMDRENLIYRPVSPFSIMRLLSNPMCKKKIVNVTLKQLIDSFLQQERGIGRPHRHVTTSHAARYGFTHITRCSYISAPFGLVLLF
jgi:hypothetical protein